jgi:hypothetical protein
MATQHDQQQKDPKVREKARLAAALRENLKRRKAQTKGRSASGGPGGDEKPHDSAGFGDDKADR